MIALAVLLLFCALGGALYFRAYVRGKRLDESATAEFVSQTSSGDWGYRATVSGCEYRVVLTDYMYPEDDVVFLRSTGNRVGGPEARAAKRAARRLHAKRVREARLRHWSREDGS